MCFARRRRPAHPPATRTVLRTCSALAPHLLRTCSALAPHLCRTCAALVPHLCRTCAALVPHLCRTCAELVPHLCRTCAAVVPPQLCRSCAAVVPQLCRNVGGSAARRPLCFMPPCTSVSKRRLRRCTAPSNPHLRVGRALHLGPSASIPTRRAALTAPSCSLARWATRLLSHWRLLPPGRSSGRIGRPAGPRGPAGGGSPGRHAQVATPRKSFAGGRRASADARGRATRRRPERDLSPYAAASPIGRARGRPRRSRRIRARPIDRPPSRSGGSHE